MSAKNSETCKIDFEQVEKKLGYKFQNQELLKTALTHITYANAHKVESNQRLEFLGDAVLNLVVADFLFKNFNDREGHLSKMRSNLVDEENLAKVTTRMGIEKFMLISDGKPEELQKLQSVQADLFEAVLGAIFLDSNFHTAFGYALNKLGIDNVNAHKKITLKTDYKSMLQEAMQHEGKKVTYELLKEEGKPHSREYTVQILIDNERGQVATRTSKKQAEIEVAKQTLKDKGII